MQVTIKEDCKSVLLDNGIEPPMLMDIEKFIYMALESRNEMADKLQQSEAELKKRQEKEAAICPEDVGFAEYIRSLLNYQDTLKKELKTLRQDQSERITEGNNLRQRLQLAEADNAALREALQSIEWIQTQEGGDYRMALFNCPSCDAESGDGHEPDCKLHEALSAGHPGAALLKELEQLRRVSDMALADLEARAAELEGLRKVKEAIIEYIAWEETPCPFCEGETKDSRKCICFNYRELWGRVKALSGMEGGIR